MADESDEGANIGLALARDQLSEQLSGADSDDVKALGYLAVDIAAIAALVAAHAMLNRYWWASIVGFACSAAFLMFALRRQEFPSGPNPLEVYASMSASPRLDSIIALVGARLEVIRLRSTRRRFYQWSVWLLVVTSVGSVIGLLEVH
jgi:hypothetical protein